MRDVVANRSAVFLKAEKKFRKIRGFRDIPLLVSSMRKEVDAQSHVAYCHASL